MKGMKEFSLWISGKASFIQVQWPRQDHMLEMCVSFRDGKESVWLSGGNGVQVVVRNEVKEVGDRVGIVSLFIEKLREMGGACRDLSKGIR